MANTTMLPRPVTENWEWQVRGSCRSVDTEQFFHPTGERGGSRAARVKHAKQICAACPVVLQCREHALRTREEYGIWGGLDESERRRALKGQV